MRRLLIALVAAATLSVPTAVLPSTTLAQQSVRQDGLVNVFAADLIDVENVSIGAVVDVLAQVCPALDANVAAIAAAVDDSGDAQEVTCTATQNATISQNNPGGRDNQDRSPPGRVQQDGLVNVFAADLVDVRDVEVAAVVGILAQVCPALDANVAAIAAAVDDSGDAQEVTCTATQNATISQNLPGRGR